MRVFKCDRCGEMPGDHAREAGSISIVANNEDTDMGRNMDLCSKCWQGFIMTSLFKCDRCGTIFDGTSNHKSVSIKIENHEDAIANVYRHHWELCNSCNRLHEKFLRGWETIKMPEIDDSVRAISFKEAWKEKEAAGYQYGEEALEQVKFGWELAIQAGVVSIDDELEKARSVMKLLASIEGDPDSFEGFWDAVETCRQMYPDSAPKNPM